jgi:hypothetical protein
MLSAPKLSSLVEAGEITTWYTLDIDEGDGNIDLRLYETVEDALQDARLVISARDAGIAWRTVRRAKDDLGIKPAKTRYDGGWEWALPPKMAKGPEDVQQDGLDTFDDHGHLGDNSPRCWSMRI